MIKKQNKNWIYMLILVLVFVVSAITIDYSALENIKLANIGNVMSGLMTPDWSFIYDGSGEDLVSLLLITIGIAFLGTFIGTILSLPFVLFSVSDFWKNAPWVAKLGKLILNVLRAFPELVYAMIFVKMVGPGPFAGVMAIGIHQIGMIGKLFTEEIENADDTPVEAMEAVGANFWQILFYARIPQVLPMCGSLVLNHFEIAVRSASTLGLVGAGGIGAPLIFAIQARNWPTVSIILIGVIITVYLIDQLAGMIRNRLR
ncbi:MULTISPECIES: phosphonate ABC transporter, permease protein PhnE [Aerococcus]|uniref:Phosphonate ABC transporter, permease protein PhnE n=2 Tax=Aerococcus TaxID=1375 RepID=A0A178HG08_9LACT|nr:MULTISPECIES: phosphonate ABC transporter, permease protein PhnE [Aerococcus]KAA9218464.1 phosphonate ABC transporter, permease protein PhnE [Aerococcus loyolae]KAA9264927.1 phosphonate ABC transporter, permease protein PhnE [Aerococcus loyolae]MCY3025978.1 phosphonate ABC transporter, permease protein PhnE [Aerococcus loyolae]MCY3028136.1 phosphonate ABC transporter, permease protein PhnE [Aerococcus loyolae]MCY3029765.1 phosphonate ABC transporter, permease protein PhnE [Aerococcus loyola